MNLLTLHKNITGNRKHTKAGLRCTGMSWYVLNYNQYVLNVQL